MNRWLSALLLSLLLSSCMSLPGSDSEPSLRYDLPVPDGRCESGSGVPLGLTVSEVAPGLDSDRVARRTAATGEVQYLRDIRWVGRSAEVVENALARDLECKGFTVLSGHHRRGGHERLVCELRAFNLIELSGRDDAEAALSCFLFREGDDDLSFTVGGRSTVDRWSATAAIVALGSAYRQTVDELMERLPAPTAARE